MTEPKIPGGYFLISRRIVESEIWSKPPLYIKVWLYLLNKAQHKDFKQLAKGQLRTSIPEIIEGCSWYVGYRKVKPTKDQIYQIIDWLRKPHETVNEADTKATMITTMKATHGMLITIDNYCFYQNSKNYESNDEDNDEKKTKAPREQRQPDNINKNVENAENDKNEKKELYTQIENFRLRYSEQQLKVIDDYLEMIRHTRVSAKLAPNTILGMYKDWDKHPQICVEYGLKTHTTNPAYHTKKENYTLGIIRNTTAEEANEKLKKEVNNNEPSVYDNLW